MDMNSQKLSETQAIIRTSRARSVSIADRRADWARAYLSGELSDERARAELCDTGLMRPLSTLLEAVAMGFVLEAHKDDFLSVHPDFVRHLDNSLRAAVCNGHIAPGIADVVRGLFPDVDGGECEEHQ